MANSLFRVRIIFTLLITIQTLKRMRKLQLSFLLAILMSMVGTKAFAYDAEIDGIYYNFDSSAMTAEVTYGNTDYSGSITIPKFVTYEGSTYSVTAIGLYAFHECTGLTSVTIPDGVESIIGSAFRGCSGLISITIPNSVTTICTDAFHDCTGLTSVTMGNGVTSILEEAFDNCTGLTSITIPNSVTYIGVRAFANCNGLTSVIIGNGVKTIGNRAFSNCIALQDFYCYAEQVPSVTSYTFSYSPVSSGTLHVPAVSVDAYKTAEVWKDFGSIVALTDNAPKPTGIEHLTNNDGKAPNGIYDMSGKRLNTTQRGVNIIRMSDRTTRKVFVK